MYVSVYQRMQQIEQRKESEREHALQLNKIISKKRQK